MYSHSFQKIRVLIGLITLGFSINQSDLIGQVVWYNVVSVPSSPNASSLGKYGEFPIDKSTGVPSIEIPIYEINYGGIKVPISLNYHASGIKIQEEESWVGMGWSLNAGGVITRVMKGRPDDEECGTKKGFLCLADNVVKQSRVDLRYDSFDCIMKDSLDRIADNELDYEPDIFYYNFLRFSGSFNFNNQSTISVRPDERIKIISDTNQNGLFFKIIDTEGNIYVFKDIEKTRIDFRHSPITEEMEWISSWYLTYIENPKTKKKINFLYSETTGVGKNMDVNVSETKRYYFLSGNYFLLSHDFPIYNFSETIDEKYLDSISYGEPDGDTCLVRFKTESSYSYHEQLDSILISSNGKKIKRFGFLSVTLHSPSNSTSRASYRQKLVEFNEVGNNSGDLKRYLFFYDNQTLPPKDSYAVDHWGFYNGADTNSCLIPEQTLGSQTFPGANRDPNWPYTKAGILTQIAYPTGGSTTFEYENNTYYNTSSHIGGGLRIKSILSNDPITNKSLSKTYDYNNSGYLTLGYPQYKVDAKENYCENGIPRDRPIVMLYSSPVAGLGASGNSVAYENVTEYHGGETTNIGKTKTFFTVANDDGMTNPYLFFPSLSKQWLRSKVLKEITFKYNGSSYDTVQMKSYDYLNTTYSYTLGFKATRTAFLTGVGCVAPSCAQFEYSYKNFDIASTNWLLKKETEKMFFPNNKTLQSITNYYYDTISWNHFNAILTRQYNSNGDVITSRIIYPSDSTGSVIQYMKDSNMINLPITKRSFVNNIKREEYRWNYDTLNNKLIVMSAEEWISAVNQSEFRPVMVYEEYDDFGNPTQVLDKNGLRTSYLWGHNNELLIAKIENSKFKNFFYTSFEESGGNSNDGDSYTGQLSVTNGFSKSMSNLDSGQYILSYYKKVNDFWGLMLDTVSVTNGTYTISISGQVDEVRFFPVYAQVTTFTYKPLVGVTSISDPNSITTYYEYDSLNRLKFIRDNKKNIIKSIEYNYKRQSEQ